MAARSADGPKPRTRIQRRNEARILDAALEVFSAHGFHGATLERVAAVAGMSKPNVLYYFRTKRDIHAAVLERTLALWLGPLERLDPDGEPLEEIRRYALAKLRLSREAPLASRLFANEILQGGETIRDYLGRELRALVDAKCAVLRRGIDAGRLAPVEPLHLLFTIWSVTQHYADFAPQIDALHDGDEAALYAGAERTLRLLLDGGLAPRVGESAGPLAEGADTGAGPDTNARGAGRAASAMSDVDTRAAAALATGVEASARPGTAEPVAAQPRAAETRADGHATAGREAAAETSV